MALQSTGAGSLTITTLQHLAVTDRRFQQFVKMTLILIKYVDSTLVMILNTVTSTTVVVMCVMSIVNTVIHAAMDTILI